MGAYMYERVLECLQTCVQYLLKILLSDIVLRDQALTQFARCDSSRVQDLSNCLVLTIFCLASIPLCHGHRAESSLLKYMLHKRTRLAVML